MSEHLKRYKNLPGAKSTPKDTPAQPVKLAGFEELVKQLQEMTAASKQSQESLTKSLEQLSAIVASTAEQGVDMAGVIDAINGLKDKLAEKETIKMPMDYEIHFERDRNLLMKSGIRLTSVPKKLN